MHAAAATPLLSASGDPEDGPGGVVNAESGVAVFVPGGPVDVGGGVSGVSEIAIRICNS